MVIVEKINEAGCARDHGYDTWKSAKVERALMQAQDRNVMIPAERVLSDLKIVGSE